jgi:hypothetical protein
MYLVTYKLNGLWTGPDEDYSYYSSLPKFLILFKNLLRSILPDRSV